LIHILLKSRYGSCAANTDGEQECCDFFIHAFSPGLIYQDGDLIPESRRRSLNSKYNKVGLSEAAFMAWRHDQP